MGRLAHKPDPAQRRQVEAMAAYGIPEIDIAPALGIDPKTLRKHWRPKYLLFKGLPISRELLFG